MFNGILFAEILFISIFLFLKTEKIHPKYNSPKKYRPLQNLKIYHISYAVAKNIKCLLLSDTDKSLEVRKVFYVVTLTLFQGRERIHNAGEKVFFRSNIFID